MFVNMIVINLKHRVDRWKSFCQHMDDFKSKMPFITNITRIDAVEHEHPHIGCMLSHKKAIEIAKDNFWDYVLVVEDDVRFQENIIETWSNIQNTLLNNSNWSIIFGASVQVRQNDLKFHSNNLLKLNPMNGILTGTHCMLYNFKSYDSIIECISNESKSDFPYHLDLLLSTKLNSKEKPILLVVPFMALFIENDVSNIRIGKDTRIDFKNITHAQQCAINYMRLLKN